MTTLITDLDTAIAEVENMAVDYSLNVGEDDFEVWDLVVAIAGQCTPEVGRELRRVMG